MTSGEAAPARFGPPWAFLFAGLLGGWAVWACAEHWQGNPNYSYGWAVPALALVFALRRYLMTESEPGEAGAGRESAVWLAGFVLLGAIVFFLEYRREEMWHQTVVLWAICLIATGAILFVINWQGGVALRKAELFPVLFFLTAVPWPPRLEQPITSSLMKGVAAMTTELLHWLGIEAQAAGGAIALRTGLVGITEACSGIRSLQAGIMFGLAAGEWFLLRPGRRVALLAAAILLALLTNLGRTLALALQASRHGAESIDRVHDLIGNIMITVLILAIGIIGKLLSHRPPLDLAPEWRERFRRFGRNLLRPASGFFAAGTVLCLVGIFGAHFAYLRGEGQEPSQTRPRFVIRSDPANQLAAVPPEVWNELRPTSGEYVRHADPALPGGGADCFHFFWKPSVWNRFALVHRPDICMPGIGWAAEGRAETIDVDFDGQTVRFYGFRFQRGNSHALELWGAWRNGQPVPLDYSAEQVFGAAPAPASMSWEGKRRSATEIVACSVIAENSPPEKELAVALLRRVFQYKQDEQ